MTGPRRARRAQRPSSSHLDPAPQTGTADAQRPAALRSVQVSKPDDPRERVASWVAGGGALSNRAVSDALRDGDDGPAAPTGLVSALGPSTGLGADGAARAQRLGVDPSGVRVHTGAGAADVAARLDAGALAVGGHVAFAQGHYRPDTVAGQRLLDHELVHVAQGAPGVHRAPPDTDLADANADAPAGTSEDVDQIMHDEIEFHFEAADVDLVQAALDAGEAPGEEFWSELLEDPTARALHFRTALILQEATPANDDEAHELMETAMDIAADEKQTLARIGNEWAERDAWAFPETWSARVAAGLKPPSGLELDVTADDRASAEKELAEIAGRLPAYVYEHGLPVPFAAALQLQSFPFRPTLAAMPGDHIVKDFAIAARKYLKVAVRSSIAVGWAAGKQRLVQDVADGMKVVTPESWAAVATARVYQPDLDQLISMAADQGVEVLATMDAEQVDLERYEMALAKLAGLLSPLYAINAYLAASMAFINAMAEADALVAKASGDERLDRADAWADEHGYPAAAREALYKALEDNAGGMVVDTIVDVGISAIPFIGWVWRAKEAVETITDLYDAGVTLADARSRVSSATSVVSLQRGAAQMSMAETQGAATAMMTGLSALPTGGRKADVDAPHGGAAKPDVDAPAGHAGDAPAAPDRAGDVPERTGDGTAGGSGGGGSGGASGPGRVPDLLDLQQASALRNQAKEFDALAAKHDASAELEAKKGRADRAEIKRKLAEKARKEAQDRRALAEEYSSGARSARSELPGVEDFEDFFKATDDEMADAATSGDLTQIKLDPDERTPELISRLSRELLTSQHGGRVVYRVDGGKGRGLVAVDAAGNVKVSSGSTIHLNFGSPERALEFLSKDTKGGVGGRLVRFEVSEEWVQAVRSAAVPEGAGKLDTNPQLVDVKYADDQMAIPAKLTTELEDFIIPGSGREVSIDELKASLTP